MLHGDGWPPDHCSLCDCHGQMTRSRTRVCPAPAGPPDRGLPRPMVNLGLTPFSSPTPQSPPGHAGPTVPIWAGAPGGRALQGSQEAECPGPAPRPCPSLPPQHKVHLLPPFCFWVESAPGPSLPPAVSKEGNCAPIQPEQPLLSDGPSWKGPLPRGRQRRGSSGGAGVGLGPATGGQGHGKTPAQRRWLQGGHGQLALCLPWAPPWECIHSTATKPVIWMMCYGIKTL